MQKLLNTQCEGETLYLESSCESTLTVTRETITTIYAGDTLTRSGESIVLLAFINEEDDGFLGDIIRASSIIFEIWNSQGKVREVTAQITKISPGHAVAEALIEPLPPGLYTVRVRLADNSYYQSEETTSELAVYDPEAGFVYGAGIIKEDGLKMFCFNVSYSKRDQTRPRGHFSFTDRKGPRCTIRIVATSFSYLVIPENQKKAYVQGLCSFNGNHGYTFSLEIQDSDRRLFRSSDYISIVVKDPLGQVVYQFEGEITAGVIEIKREKAKGSG